MSQKSKTLLQLLQQQQHFHDDINTSLESNYRHSSEHTEKKFDLKLQKSILDLYSQIKSNILKTEDHLLLCQIRKLVPLDKSEDLYTDPNSLICYIGCIFTVLMQDKLNLEQQVDEQKTRDQSEYEEQLVKLEAEIRQHIRIEQQLKLFAENTQSKLEDALKIKEELEEELQGIKSDFQVLYDKNNTLNQKLRLQEKEIQIIKNNIAYFLFFLIFSIFQKQVIFQKLFQQSPLVQLKLQINLQNLHHTIKNLYLKKKIQKMKIQNNNLLQSIYKLRNKSLLFKTIKIEFKLIHKMIILNQEMILIKELFQLMLPILKIINLIIYVLEHKQNHVNIKKEKENIIHLIMKLLMLQNIREIRQLKMYQIQQELKRQQSVKACQDKAQINQNKVIKKPSTSQHAEPNRSNNSVHSFRKQPPEVSQIPRPFSCAEQIEESHNSFQKDLSMDMGNYQKQSGDYSDNQQQIKKLLQQYQQKHSLNDTLTKKLLQEYKKRQGYNCKTIY